MNLRVNGESYEVQEGTTVGQILEQLNLHADRVVVELNHQIFDVAREGTHKELQDKDQLEIIQFVGGG